MWHSRTSLERYDTPSPHPLGSLSSKRDSAKTSDLGSVGSDSWPLLFTLAMDIDMMIKEARLRIVIGIKNAICTGLATQPVTSALIVPFTVRIHNAGGCVVVGFTEYKNRTYVSCGMMMSKGSEELFAVQTQSPRMPCIIASYSGRYWSFGGGNLKAWFPRSVIDSATRLLTVFWAITKTSTNANIASWMRSEKKW